MFEAALKLGRERALILAELRSALIRGEDALALVLARQLAGLEPSSERAKFQTQTRHSLRNEAAMASGEWTKTSDLINTAVGILEI